LSEYHSVLFVVNVSWVTGQPYDAVGMATTLAPTTGLELES
jgi:hypothetical protein